MLDTLFQQLQQHSQLPPDNARLFHGRGHCYPQLEFINIDWFAPVVWVVIYGEQPAHLLQQLSIQLAEWAAVHPAVHCVAIQQRVKGKATQYVCYGEMPESCYAQENGMRFLLNFTENQNIGFFPDAQPARHWVYEQAKGKRVLNLFAYTCSFSVAALKGGAQSVLNMDMAKSVLAVGQRNHALNACDGTNVQFMPHDVFRSTRKLEDNGPYDLIILDPPSRQKGSFEAEKDYPKLISKLKPMLADNAQILACLNAPYLPEDFLPSAFAQHLPQYSLQQRLPQRADFPEKDENCCLKMQVFAV